VRALAIINPVAGRGRATRVWEHLRREVAGVRGWECATSQRVGHARELAQAAAGAGYECVVAVGGDGTVCEVASGVAHTMTALASIPAGTGNDSARNLGIPSHPLAAASLVLQGKPRRIDVGEIRTAQAASCFVNVAGFGFDAEVAWRVNRIPRVVGGTAPYVAGVLQTLWRYRSPRVRINLGGADEERLVDRQAFLVAVANGASYGGGMLIAPEARPDDGLFDVCLVGDVTRLEVLRLVPRLYSGGHRHHPSVEFFRCRELTADADQQVRCHADGELVGYLPASFRLYPGGLLCVAG
jgi:diacylglycerol kinase (ATP)